ncbi:MAG: hypothetical protein AAGB12_10565 [Pseudomonadota bacterium]
MKKKAIFVHKASISGMIYTLIRVACLFVFGNAYAQGRQDIYLGTLIQQSLQSGTSIHSEGKQFLAQALTQVDGQQITGTPKHCNAHGKFSCGLEAQEFCLLDETPLERLRQDVAQCMQANAQGIIIVRNPNYSIENASALDLFFDTKKTPIVSVDKATGDWLVKHQQRVISLSLYNDKVVTKALCHTLMLTEKWAFFKASCLQKADIDSLYIQTNQQKTPKGRFSNLPIRKTQNYLPSKSYFSDDAHLAMNESYAIFELVPDLSSSTQSSVEIKVDEKQIKTLYQELPKHKDWVKTTTAHIALFEKRHQIISNVHHPKSFSVNFIDQHKHPEKTSVNLQQNAKGPFVIKNIECNKEEDSNLTDERDCWIDIQYNPSIEGVDLAFITFSNEKDKDTDSHPKIILKGIGLGHHPQLSALSNFDAKLTWFKALDKSTPGENTTIMQVSTRQDTGKLSFEWKTGGSKDDEFLLLINDQLVETLTFNQDWQAVTIALPEYTDNITWIHVSNNIKQPSKPEQLLRAVSIN